jgi:hypothetical protein
VRLERNLVLGLDCLCRTGKSIDNIAALSRDDGWWTSRLVPELLS